MFKNFMTYAALFLVCSSLLAGCGRKGALEPPPSARIESENGQSQEKPKRDTPFILDKLIQ